MSTAPQSHPRICTVCRKVVGSDDKVVLFTIAGKPSFAVHEKDCAAKVRAVAMVGAEAAKNTLERHYPGVLGRIQRTYAFLKGLDSKESDDARGPTE